MPCCFHSISNQYHTPPLFPNTNTPLPPMTMHTMETSYSQYLQRLRDGAKAITRSDESSSPCIHRHRQPQSVLHSRHQSSCHFESSTPSSATSKKRKCGRTSTYASSGTSGRDSTSIVGSKTKKAKMSSLSSTAPAPILCDTRNPEIITNAQYENILALMNEFCKVPFLAEFRRPAILIHPEKATLYSKIIPNPIDFGYVCRTIHRRGYKTIHAIQLDVLRVFSNCIEFHTHPDNSEGSSPSTIAMAMHLRDYFNSLWYEFMMPSEAPPRLRGRGVSNVETTFQKRLQWRQEGFPIIETTVLTAKFMKRLRIAFESFISSGGRVDNLDSDAILEDDTSATSDIVTFVASLRRVISNYYMEVVMNNQQYTVFDLHEDVTQCYTGGIFQNVALKAKIAQRLDRILGKALAPIREKSCRGVNQSTIWGSADHIVWARESKTKPYWPAIVLGMLAPNHLREDWHKSLTDCNEARLPQKIRDDLRVAKKQAKIHMKENQECAFFLVEFLGGRHVFVWTTEDDIIEPFDPDRNVNAVSTAYNADQMSNAMEEGRQFADACSDGFVADDENDDSVLTFATLCQNDDEADAIMAVEREQARGSKLDKLNESGSTDGLVSLGRTNENGRASKPNQQSAPEIQKKTSAEAKDTLQGDSNTMRWTKERARIALLDDIQKKTSAKAQDSPQVDNNTLNWTKERAHIALLDSASRSECESNVSHPVTEQPHQSNGENSPPPLQGESRDAIPTRIQGLKLHDTNRNDIGRCGSPSGFSPSDFSSVASPPIHVTNSQRRVANVGNASTIPTFHNSASSASRTIASLSNDARKLKFNGIYSPIKDSRTTSSNSSPSSTSSAISPPNIPNVPPINVTGNTAHHDTAAANEWNSSASKQNFVIDLTFDSSDGDDIESISQQDRREDGYGGRDVHGNDLTNDVSLASSFGRSSILPVTTTDSNSKRRQPSSEEPRRITTNQTVNSSRELQCGNNILQEPHTAVHENTNAIRVDVDTPVEMNAAAMNTPHDGDRIRTSKSNTSPIDSSMELSQDKVTAEKPPLISCGLTGTLSATRKNGTACHVIRGTWVNKEFPSSTPLEFVLRRDIPPENKSIDLMADGDFSGFFKCRAPDKNGRLKDIRIEENVRILFMERTSALHSYNLSGAGENQIGKFELVGEARRNNGTMNYHLEFQKAYTELAQPTCPNTANPTTTSSRNMMQLSSADDSEERYRGDAGTRNKSTDSSRTATIATHDIGAASRLQQLVSSVSDMKERKTTMQNQNKVIELLFDSSDEENRIENNNLRQDGHGARRNTMQCDTNTDTDTMPVDGSDVYQDNHLRPNNCVNGTNAARIESDATPVDSDASETVDRRKVFFDVTKAEPRPKACFPLQGAYPAKPISSFSYHFFKFLTSIGLTSDETLSNADPMSLRRRYTEYLQTLGISHRVCQEACRVQGLIKCANGNQWKSRVEKDSDEAIMNNVPYFCKDELVNGLPMRTIFTIGPSYDILYEFVISIKQSACCPAAGNGAFLTFKGAKMLRKGSKWKRASYLQRAAVTRGTREAYLSDSRYTVTVTGADIHDDNRVDFVAEDFIDAPNNITFSSKHIECGIVELESRYGPLLPTDRKTDLVFTVKDFLFSHEPSSWRFDVEETLNTESFEPDASPTHYIIRSPHTEQPNRVIDFTDDATGAPHEVAQSHVSMYVNEVGHDATLVENIDAVGNGGSIIYYINIDKPLSRGDTVELLTNYSDVYETMRVRRGYGKDNLSNAVKGDDNDISRVKRNVRERFEIERTIKTYLLHDVVEVVHFLYDRVWGSLRGVTSTFDTGCRDADLNLPRQCVARRRIHWITRLISNHLRGILGNWSAVQYQEGNLIFVHEWPPKSSRPPYTGLAVIDSIAKDEHNRETFKVTTSDNKCIWDVPEGVVTFPTTDDMKKASKREWKKWKQWKAEQAIPQILDYLESFKWDASFATSLKASLPTSQSESTILNSLRWDFVEEMMFLLEKNNRVSLNNRCLMSATFVLECLFLIADFLLMDNDMGDLFRSLMELGRVAMYNVKATNERIGTPPDQDTLSNFCFETRTSAAQRRLVVEPNYEVSLEQFLNNPTHLDCDWYAIHQIALPLHNIASLLDWGNLYSVETLCNELSLTLSCSDERSKFKDWKPLM